MRELVKKQKVFRSASQDVTSKAGELEVTAPVDPVTGLCPHKYLSPVAGNSKMCHLPGRVEMFQHYAFTGGKYGAKVCKKSNSKFLHCLYR